MKGRDLAFAVTFGAGLVACGGAIGPSPGDGGGGVDASIPEGSILPLEAGDAVESCAEKNVSACLVKPFSCYGGPTPTLAEIEKLYAGLAPTDTCPGGSVWVERHEGCALVEVHSFQRRKTPDRADG